ACTAIVAGRPAWRQRAAQSAAPVRSSATISSDAVDIKGITLRDTLREPFSRTDRQIEVVLWWRQRAGPARVEGAGGVIRKVKVEDERVPRRITAQVRALRAVEQVAARSVGVHAVRCIAERQVEP